MPDLKGTGSANSFHWLPEAVQGCIQMLNRRLDDTEIGCWRAVLIYLYELQLEYNEMLETCKGILDSLEDLDEGVEEEKAELRDVIAEAGRKANE